MVNKTKNKKQTNYYQNILSIFEIGNEIGSEGEKWIAEFEKEQKQKCLKWFENGKNGNFSALKEMKIQKRANINWVDDEVLFFASTFFFCLSFFRLIHVVNQ